MRTDRDVMKCSNCTDTCLNVLVSLTTETFYGKMGV